MKKVFAILAITTFMVACNNEAEKTETKTDSVTTTAPETVAPDTTMAPVDTTTAPVTDTTKK